ncbi:MAG TPA: peptidoglycan DD-metalloendopeptidase family protein [Burkholderiaceae bacterium]
MMRRTSAGRAIPSRHWIAALGALLPLLALLAGGCEEVPLNQAPIVEHSAASAKPPGGATTPPPATREARDGNYLVQRGDTLYSIALAFGQDFRDIARWSGLDDPTRIKVGQMLRVAPPAGGAAPVPPVAAPASADADASAEVTAIPVAPPSGAVQTRPLENIETAPASAPASPPATAPALPPSGGTGGGTGGATAPAAAAPPGAGAVPPLAAASPGPLPPAAGAKPAPVEAPLAEPNAGWTWPAAGKLLERFDAARNKGIDIGGSLGSSVVAANDGQIVYVGSGLRGYGNLVIIKHTDDYVSAYAHNQQILVKQGQTVKRGQPIAELGQTDAPDPRLHFEIRRKGKPVDPLAYLPPR